MEKIDTLTKQVLKRISPKNEDYAKVDGIASELEKKIASACQAQSIQAIVRVEGSVAKDTWLRENPDIDIFVRFSNAIPRNKLGEIGLKIAYQAAGAYRKIERFAEHPYLEIFAKGYRVDIVPCYEVKPGEWQSATDRTPYHTDYVKRHLSKDLLGEVRLLKKFMQSIDVYGAEIKVGGFSGYLCELLIMRFRSFVETIRAFAQYSQRIVIDIENHYVSREKEIPLLFPEALVIIDPVDKGRNAASAVQPLKLYRLIGAARAFLKKPDKVFFDPPEPEVLRVAALKSKLKRRGSAVVFLVVSQMNAVPDVLWGQLYKTRRSLRKLISLNDYEILKDAVWSNEKTFSIFVFELEQQILPNIKRHIGPPLERKAESENFLFKYTCNANVISGPYIEDGRWIVQIPRKTTDIVALLREKLADGGKNSGVAELIAKSIQKNLRVLVNEEITTIYRKNKDFAEFFTDFLFYKPFWLRVS
jgi:tRNA nucleotidyltransferase (CCA-adding enzyme)